MNLLEIIQSASIIFLDIVVIGFIFQIDTLQHRKK